MHRPLDSQSDDEKNRTSGRNRKLWIRLALSLCLALLAVIATGVIGYHDFRRVIVVGRARPAPILVHADPNNQTWLWLEWRGRSARFGDAYRAIEAADPHTVLDSHKVAPWPPSPPIPAHFRQFHWLEVGWPLKCFVAMHAIYTDSAKVTGGKTLRGFDRDAPSTPDWLRPAGGVTGWGHTIYPTSVRWPYFLVNMLAWGAGAWCILSTPAFLLGWRRRRRLKRGLCPTCAYCLEGVSGPCPECGTRSWRLISYGS